jgi:hypothetical protein
MRGCSAIVTTRNHASELEAGDPIPGNDSDHPHTFSSMTNSLKSSESTVEEHTYNEIGAHPINPRSIFFHNQAEFIIHGVEFKSHKGNGSILANIDSDIERQRKAALTIQESFRRKRYVRCLKRVLLAERLLFDAQLARGACRLLIHLAIFATYLASLDLSSNGLAK